MRGLVLRVAAAIIVFSFVFFDHSGGDSRTFETPDVEVRGNPIRAIRVADELAVVAAVSKARAMLQRRLTGLEAIAS